jgi:hypothetical protein
MLWNPAEHSYQANLMWSHMRAIEWNAWPSFISQPIIPILFLFCPWLTVIISLVVVNLLWALLIRPHFVLPALAALAVTLVRLKLITIPVVVMILALRGDYVLAAVSLCWPLLAGLGSFVPGSLNKTRRVFMASLGYEYPAPHAG